MPFELASDVENPGWRTGVQMMMGAFGIDSAPKCRRAWKAIIDSSGDSSFPPEVLAEMNERFHAFPFTPVEQERQQEQTGTTEGDVAIEWVPYTEATYRTVRNQWRDPVREARLKIRYTGYFIDRYEEIIAMGRSREIVPLPDDPMATGIPASARSAQRPPEAAAP